MVFFHFDMKRETYIVPFGADDYFKEMGVRPTSYEHIYYLSPESDYEVDEILNKIHEDTFFMNRLYNINVLNIDCPEIINYIINLMGKEMGEDKDLLKQMKRWFMKIND